MDLEFLQGEGQTFVEIRINDRPSNLFRQILFLDKKKCKKCISYNFHEIFIFRNYENNILFIPTKTL